MITKFQTCSDFVNTAIKYMYPKGYVTVINCWFSYLFYKDGFKLKEKLHKLPELRSCLPDLEYGYCLIFFSEEEDKAWEVYKVFDDPDEVYVKDRGIRNENT